MRHGARDGTTGGARLRRADRRGDHRARIRRSGTRSASFCYDPRRAATRSGLARRSQLGRSSARSGSASSSCSGSRRPTGRSRTRVDGSRIPGSSALATLHRALPAVPRPDHLHVLPAARVHPGRPRARARDQGDGGASRAPRPALPGVPRAASSPRTSSAPSARRGFATRAPACGQPLESLWQVCPYCATEIPPTLPSLEDVPPRAPRRDDRRRVD